MKKSILITLTVATSLFIAACGGNSPTKEESHEGHDHAMSEAPTEAIPVQSIQVNDDVLNAVYQEYVKLNLALVNSNDADAQIAANTLELGAKELAGGGTIVSSAAKITEAATLKEKRAAFSDLSNELIVLVKESGLKSGELYIDFCPMALNDEGGYWLSSEKGIKNPYFGDSMLTCGETKETLN
jgi:hypothetical protein